MQQWPEDQYSWGLQDSGAGATCFCSKTKSELVAVVTISWKRQETFY